ncbi:MAG TPA: SDR family oxidoreductase [Methylomirabilota bacterium]|nr:SDR family oxidoreductase [Methylomirabilota bacterium]
MSPAPIWITGAQGLIGHRLLNSAPPSIDPASLQPLARQDLDLLDFNAVKQRFETDRPSLVIHCAGLTRSPDCEARPGLARRLNVDVTRHLCDLARDIPLVFFSTDLVFDGTRGGYVEDDPPHPLGVYAQTKLEAERSILLNPRHLVIRTSLNAGRSPSGNRSFTEQMLQAWREGRTLRLFTDEFRCPIPAETTARAVWELVEKRASGLLHLAGSERLSRRDIGELLARQVPQLNPRVEAASIRDYQGAPRPADTSLNCARIQALLSFSLPRFSEWLEQHPEELR